MAKILKTFALRLKQSPSRTQAILLYTVHLNPQVQEPVRKTLGGIPNIFLLPPLDYAPFIYLMQRCHLILTDSGGVQEEAPSLNKPLLVMREVTERPEAIATGAGRLVGTDPNRIIANVKELMTKQRIYRQMVAAPNPYSDGKAAARIAAALSKVKINIERRSFSSKLGLAAAPQ